MGIPLAVLELSPCPLGIVRGFIEKHHYSHSVNGVKVAQCFSVHANQALVGAILFGAMSTTAWRRFGDVESSVLELRRLVLLDDVERNAESFVVGWTLRWLQRNMPSVDVVVSYADPAQGHDGAIYRAANFEYQGLSGADKGYGDIETGKTYHSRALRTTYKGEYKPFVLRLRQRLADGGLIPVVLPGKHRYVYYMKRKKREASRAQSKSEA